MIVLVGDTGMREYVATLKRHGWGRIYTTDRPRPYPGEPWALDSNVYSDHINGRKFSQSGYRDRLARALTVSSAPYMAVVPDAVGDWEETIKLFWAWIDELPRWPWYVVFQDGAERDLKSAAQMLTHPKVAGGFLGGSDLFKRHALLFSEFCHRLNKRFHYGRASTPKRMRYAKFADADSMDTSFPLWTRERFALMERVVLDDPQMSWTWIAGA